MYSPKFSISSTSSSSSDLHELDLLPELWQSSSNESQVLFTKLDHRIVKPSIWSNVPTQPSIVLPDNLLDLDIHIPSTSTTIGIHDNTASFNNKNIYTYNYYGTYSVDDQQDLFNKGNVNTQLYKTELCASYMKMGVCPYGNKCQFAHGENELKKVERNPKWRSKPCVNWVKWGTCRYGSRCSFKHDPEYMVKEVPDYLVKQNCFNGGLIA